MDELAHAHIQLPSTLSNEPIICAGARTIHLGKRETQLACVLGEIPTLGLAKTATCLDAPRSEGASLHAALNERFEVWCFSVVIFLSITTF
jgi:hypothetical protein